MDTWLIFFIIVTIYALVITILYFLRITRIPRKRKRVKSIPRELFIEVERINGDLDSFRSAIIEKSLIGIILGRRGSGKTALALRIAEALRGKKKIYAMGISNAPRWIKIIDNIDKAQPDSLLIVDEGAILLGARASMKELNKKFSNLMAISRHRDLSLLIITQNSAMLEVNTLRLADYLLIKKPSLLQSEMERPQIKRIIGKADKAIPDEDFPKYCYIISDYYEGLVKTSLPGFWSEKISKSMKHTKNI
ncbi:hypothetical protein J7K74_00415 [Candidatus Woesearchaeota archaeon]|nr:hypothetical protein [Candidatus Woesearchaeota archaeon]